MKEGFELMLIGMGVVFCFLVLLVVCLQVMGKFFEKFSHLFPEPEPPATASMLAADHPQAATAIALAAAYRARAGKTR